MLDHYFIPFISCTIQKEKNVFQKRGRDMFERETAVIASFEMCPTCRDISVLVPVQTVKKMVTHFNQDFDTSDIGHYFCLNEECEIVYFSQEYQYTVRDCHTAIYQKDSGEDVPVCYCYNLTREKIKSMISSNIDPVAYLDEKMKEEGCNCALSNPQGSCCRNNIILYSQKVKGESE